MQHLDLFVQCPSAFKCIFTIFECLPHIFHAFTLSSTNLCTDLVHLNVCFLSTSYVKLNCKLENNSDLHVFIIREKTSHISRCFKDFEEKI